MHQKTSDKFHTWNSKFLSIADITVILDRKGNWCIIHAYDAVVADSNTESIFTKIINDWLCTIKSLLVVTPTGKAINNFQLKLPEPQSDLEEQTLKDPYNFDFLTLREKYDEKELEDALVNQITQFLLELGTGFLYLGRQVHIKVGETDFYMDLLFCHM